MYYPGWPSGATQKHITQTIPWDFIVQKNKNKDKYSVISFWFGRVFVTCVEDNYLSNNFQSSYFRALDTYLRQY